MKHWPDEYALDPVLFAREALGFEPDAKQQLVLDPTIHRGLLNCSRQWGKSTLTALKAVHWAWFRPGSNIVVMSPTERQSGEFVQKAQDFVATLGVTPRGDGHNRVSIRLPNGSRIVGLPGERAKVRGFSKVSLMLIDEAAEVTDRAYLSVRPMLAMGGPNGGQLWLMSTPEGQRGFFWKAWTQGDAKWTRISVTALENARFSAEFLEDERNEMGDRMFRQEYLCEFVDRHDAMFSDEDIEACISDDIPTLW